MAEVRRLFSAGPVTYPPYLEGYRRLTDALPGVFHVFSVAVGTDDHLEIVVTADRPLDESQDAATVLLELFEQHLGEYTWDPYNRGEEDDDGFADWEERNREREWANAGLL
jgi:hypothetical protein